MKTLPLKAWGMPGPVELIILLVILLVIFGPGKLPQVGKSIGGAISEFKDSVKGKRDEDKKPEEPAQKDDTAE